MSRIGALVTGALLAAAPARAQLPSIYTGAAPLAVNAHVFGAYIPMSSHSAGGLAQLRLSFFPGVDFGFQGGLLRLDRDTGGRTALRLGTDIKIAIAKATPGHPLDFSLGGTIGVLNGDDYSLIALGPTALVSRTLRAGQTGEITPFAGLGLAFTSLNQSASDHTDFSVPLRIGSEFAVSPAARLVAEIEFRLGQDAGDDVGVTLGVNLPF
jgi:hypothetical protein